MEQQLTNSNKLNKCFFAKQMTYLESTDFAKNYSHIQECLDCRKTLNQFDLRKDNFKQYFDSFAANAEIAKNLESELKEIVPEINDELESRPIVKKQKYALAFRDFLVFILFGIPRKIQLAVVATLILAACIY